jgi:hypothetical protein
MIIESFLERYCPLNRKARVVDDLMLFSTCGYGFIVESGNIFNLKVVGVPSLRKP